MIDNYIYDTLSITSPVIAQYIKKEQERQQQNIELIASENYPSDAIRIAQASCLVAKYSEGYPGKRYYGGCQVVDEIETYCQQKWQEVFNTNYHVNVQPHSGSQANYAAYAAVLRPGDTVLAMDLDNGGHLTHGSSVNFSGKLYNFIFYGLDKNGFINYEELESLIRLYQPNMVLAGASAYSRIIDYQRIKDIIDRQSYYKEYQHPHNGDWTIYEYKPYFMVDMAHVAGLIAAGDHPSPFGLADIITTTTHKTLRGPRGGMIFCKPELAKKIDSAIFPGSQGGPLQHIIAAKAICAEEACTDEFKEYIHQVVKNSKAMAQEFVNMGYDVVTGGTDNHMFLLDLTKTGLTGKQVQDGLDKIHIALNKNCVPNETRKPSETSGVRIGTAAMTTKGFKEQDFINVAHKIDDFIKQL